MPTHISLFAKAPIPHHAKTRLIPALGAQGAARLHQTLVRHALAAACSVRLGLVTLHYSEPHPFFLRLARRNTLALKQQAPGDLGAKMFAALLPARHPTLLLGSDCPTITPRVLHQCSQALQHKQVVILPAEDGGYGLIGVQHGRISGLEQLFDGISWGTDHVLEQTRSRLRHLELSWSEPATIWDVDTPEDLARLRESGLSMGSIHSCNV